MRNGDCVYKGTEPSPKGMGICAHLKSVNDMVEGRDGNMWIVAMDKIGRKAWKKAPKPAARPPKPAVAPRPPKPAASPRPPKPAASAQRSPKSTGIAKQPMLADKYDAKMDPTGMWVSEKLDGIRAMYIDGKFLSRTGLQFAVPKWFYDAMPKGVSLDGELYTTRGDFQHISSIVSKKKPVDTEWKTIKYMVFDVPITNAPFEERYRMLQKIVTENSSPYLKLVENIPVMSRNHMDVLHRQIMDKDGEGLMLRVPGSLYQPKRTKDLLKVKKDMDDEAVVIGHLRGTGKNAHRLGKLAVKWQHSKETFHVGTGFTDEQRDDFERLFPLKTIVKVKFNGMTGTNKPRFPVFIGIRAPIDLPRKADRY